MKRIILFLLILTGLTSAQKKDPEKIIEQVKEKFAKVEDYVVDVNIKIDVERLKAPDTKAKIYYKQPDKIHIESESFALLPKNGLNFSPSALLDADEFTSIYERTDTINGHKTDVIKVIPLNKILWIDEKEFIIRKVESSMKIGATYTLDLKYENNFDYPLPSEMIFTFNSDEMNMRNKVMDDTESKSREKQRRDTKGKVYITYKNYKVNKGIPDSVFEEKEK